MAAGSTRDPRRPAGDAPKRRPVLLNARGFRTLALRMECTALVVLTTLNTEADARRLIRGLLEARLVACGTVLPGARSLYRWEGEVTEETEAVVLLKTDASKWDGLVAHIREDHPYKVPELLALPVSRGLDAYLGWLRGEVSA